MALSFGTRIKFLLGHIWLSISSKVIRGPSSLVLPSLPSLVSILLPMVFNKSVFAPTRASLGVYTNLMFFYNAVSRWAQLVSFVCGMLNYYGKWFTGRVYSCNKTWHWVERTYKATVISSRLCHSSVVQLYYLLRLWLCVLRLLGSLRTSKTCLRHRRLLKRTTNVQSWKIFTSIKTLLPSHRSLRSLKLPPQLMFWFSN